jgi:hypothetical protein
VAKLVVSLGGPTGWTVQPVTSATDNAVNTNSTFTITRGVAPPPGTTPGSYTLTVTARYL